VWRARETRSRRARLGRMSQTRVAYLGSERQL
jgi:hypothetical protein